MGNSAPRFLMEEDKIAIRRLIQDGQTVNQVARTLGFKSDTSIRKLLKKDPELHKKSIENGKERMVAIGYDSKSKKGWYQ